MSKYKITFGDTSQYKIVFKDGEFTGWIDVKTEDVRIEVENNMGGKTLSSNDRRILYNKIKIGHKVKITNGKNKGKIGEITSISKIKNSGYKSGMHNCNYNNYFSVNVKLNDGRITNTSCDYIKLIENKIERKNNMIKQEFDKLYLKNKIAVQCKTKELAIEFLALADKFGYKWYSGSRLTDPSTCHLYGKDTVYYPSDFGWQYGSIKNVHTQGYELVEYKREQPKSLYEQALELVGLKIGDRFLINCSEFEVNSDNIYFVLNNKRSKTSYGDALISLLHNKDLLVKIKPNPKSEAELILDELEKVVDKAKAVLERSGR